jgi:hypothetical protein
LRYPTVLLGQFRSVEIQASAAASNAYAAGVAAGAAARPVYAMGDIYTTPPTGCVYSPVNGVAHYNSAGTWFSPYCGANGMYCRVVPVPNPFSSTTSQLDFGHFWDPITSPEQDTINGPIIKCCTVNVRRKVCCLTRMVRIFASASYGIGNRLLH